MNRKDNLDSIIEQFTLEKSDTNGLEEIKYEKNRKKLSSVENSEESSEEIQEPVLPSKRARKSICPVTLPKRPNIAPLSKDSSERETLLSSLSKSFLFSGLDYTELLTIIDSMTEKHVASETNLITQGEECNELYILKSGKFNISKDSELPIESNPGAMIGEIGLLHSSSHTFTVTTIEQSTFWVLDRDTFVSLVRESAIKTREKCENLLKQVFKGVDSETLGKLFDGCQYEFFCTGESIARKGQDTGKLFVIYDGKADSLEKQNIEYVWERDLDSSVVADTSTKCLTLTHERIQRILEI